ncbi:MAG: M3 family oligoendopeptidase [Tissierellia bacterium]|nr:M3 family oligoendopeptidase [Tissierellia bacterium]
MKFKEYEYKRPNLDEVEQKFHQALDHFSELSPKEQIKRIYDIVEIRKEVDSNITLVTIRHSINTKDEFYEKEVEFIDENSPRYHELVDRFYKTVMASPHLEELKEEFGDLFFDQIETQLKVFSPEIMEDLVEENKLSTKYDKLIASAEIEYDGKINNLSDMSPYLQSKDRNIRKEAYEKVNGFFTEHLEEIDQIYDELVHVRDRMAKKLGFKNFVEMGYLRMRRTDYGPEEVANYRKQVLESVVPVSNDLREHQKKRIGVDSLKAYDLPLAFTSGNAAPHGNDDWIMKNGQTMYSELGELPKEFFDFMTEHELFDVKARKGKQGGGYCTYIPKYRSPFIFANFNGTSGDVDVLTHEAGHAFQVYLSRDFTLPEYVWPTYEACEIHSMSMEFLTWPWMDLFFEEEADKYRYQHLSSAVNFIPYGVTIDEFQHFVYENPDITPEERRKEYSKIEKKYRPYLDYDGAELLENGGFWLRQSHVFSMPFYYIDYTLAQVCAFQFFGKSREDHDKAMEDYIRLCKEGGSQSFLNLVKVAGLENPFDDGTIKRSMVKVHEYLDSVDDEQFD